MGVPTFKEAKRFFRVAEQRFADAEFLLSNDRTTAAVYFAGNGVECMLKAVLLHLTPQKKHAETMASFVGERGHNLRWLLHRCRLQGLKVSDPFRDAFLLTSTWTTAFWYEPGIIPYKEAVQFLSKAKIAIEMLKARI